MWGAFLTRPVIISTKHYHKQTKYVLHFVFVTKEDCVLAENSDNFSLMWTIWENTKIMLIYMFDLILNLFFLMLSVICSKL